MQGLFRPRHCSSSFGLAGMNRTAILLSGGMDSIALAHMFRPSVALTIDYGQLSAPGELRAASAVADTLSVRHETITANLRPIGSGDMAGRDPSDRAPVPEWWPFRNQMLITLAAMRGIALGVTRLLMGTVKGDSAHADGRREFVETMDAILRLQEGGISLEAPALDLSTPELIRTSGVPWDLLAWSHSCHVAEYACGTCRGCHKHYQTCEALGVDSY